MTTNQQNKKPLSAHMRDFSKTAGVPITGPVSAPLPTGLSELADKLAKAPTQLDKCEMLCEALTLRPDTTDPQYRDLILAGITQLALVAEQAGELSRYQARIMPEEVRLGQLLSAYMQRVDPMLPSRMTADQLQHGSAVGQACILVSDLLQQYSQSWRGWWKGLFAR